MRHHARRCALVAYALLLTLVPAAAAAPGDGATPSSAHLLTSGVTFHGTTVGTTLDAASVSHDDFSTLALHAGDHLVIDWIGGRNTLDLLPLGTTDTTSLTTVKPLFSVPPWTEGVSGPLHRLSQYYLVKTSGDYTFRAYTDGSPPSPYTLTAFVQRGAHADTCPMRVQTSFVAGRPFTIRVTEPGIEHGTPAGLGMFVALKHLLPGGTRHPVAFTRSTGTPSAGKDLWTFVQTTSAPQPAGRYEWVVAPQSVVRDRNSYFCIPAIVDKFVTVR